jgi:hypothetical protein
VQPILFHEATLGASKIGVQHKFSPRPALPPPWANTAGIIFNFQCPIANLAVGSARCADWSPQRGDPTQRHRIWGENAGFAGLLPNFWNLKQKAVFQRLTPFLGSKRPFLRFPK